MPWNHRLPCRGIGDSHGVEYALADYIEAIELVEPTSVPRVIIADADDDHVIAPAVAAHADVIVSGDRKHLLPLGSHQGIVIIEAAKAVKRIASG